MKVAQIVLLVVGIFVDILIVLFVYHFFNDFIVAMVSMLGSTNFPQQIASVLFIGFLMIDFGFMVKLSQYILELDG